MYTLHAILDTQELNFYKINKELIRFNSIPRKVWCCALKHSIMIMFHTKELAVFAANIFELKTTNEIITHSIYYSVSLRLTLEYTNNPQNRTFNIGK